MGRFAFYGWRIAAALGVTTIISYGTTQYLFGVLVAPLSSDLGWSRGDISGAYALAVIVQGVLGVPVGRFVDRRGARLAMAVGSLIGVLSLIGLATVQDIPAFYLWWAGGNGIAMALTLYPVSFTVIANWFDRRRGTALAVLTVLGGLAAPIFVPFAGVLTESIGWRSMLLVLAGVQLALAVPLHALVLRHRPEDSDSCLTARRRSGLPAWSRAATPSPERW